nr:hypothetical protein [Streptomyces sp. MMG1121]
MTPVTPSSHRCTLRYRSCIGLRAWPGHTKRAGYGRPGRQPPDAHDRVRPGPTERAGR